MVRCLEKRYVPPAMRGQAPLGDVPEGRPARNFPSSDRRDHGFNDGPMHKSQSFAGVNQDDGGRGSFGFNRGGGGGRGFGNDGGYR